MVKNALKNFFKNLSYVFVPMGIVYLFFLIAVFIFIGSLVQSAGVMLSEAFSLVQSSVSESSASVNDFFSYAFGQLEWNGSFIHMIVRAFQTRWLSNTLIGFLETLNASTEGFGDQIYAIMDNFMAKLGAIVSVAATLCVLGIIFANFLTRVMVRKRTAKRGFKKFFVAHTVVPIVQSLFVVISVVVLVIIRYYGLLVVAALVVLSCTFSLTSSWIVHRNGDLKWKDVVTGKNILMHLASVGVILLLNIALAAAFFAVEPLLAILVMIPVILYSLNIVGVNTDSFVCGMIEERRAAAEATDATALPAEGAETAEIAEGGELPAPAEEKLAEKKAGGATEAAAETTGEPASEEEKKIL